MEFREIKNGAIFISDAHENSKRKFFKDFLKNIKNKKIPIPPQLFLMGDIFDILVGGVKHTEELAKEYINDLEELATKCEIYYFEGNHDFNLSNLFTKVKIISIEKQPMKFKTIHGNVLLLHGDKYTKFVERNFMKLMRISFVICFLNFINEIFARKISNNLYKKLENKNICKKINNFEKIISKKIKFYDTKNIVLIAEGHYHQNTFITFDNIVYKNFNSFACDQSYIIVQLSDFIEFTHISQVSKNT